jgi:hypothetical protein
MANTALTRACVEYLNFAYFSIHHSTPDAVSEAFYLAGKRVFQKCLQIPTLGLMDYRGWQFSEACPGIFQITVSTGAYPDPHKSIPTIFRSF